MPHPHVQLQINSETDHLRQLIVHTPGDEMDMVSPQDRESLLFEDILYLQHARNEHRLMCRIFEKVVGEEGGVFQIADLLREAFDIEDARRSFISQFCAISPGLNLQAYEDDLNRLSPDELFTFALTGNSPLPILAQPLPNLIFMRDVAAVVGNHVVVSHAATAARARESVLVHVVLHYHPSFASWRDNIITLPKGVTFEGGDLLVVSEDTVLIGCSERTSFGGIISVTGHLFQKTPVRNVLMFTLPHERYCMHLDTVFTFTSADECVVYPPLINQSNLGNVVLLQPGEEPGAFSCRTFVNLHTALQDLTGRTITFTPCGGLDHLSQQREQWTDGANLFAVAPGVVIGYERNARTFEELALLGYRIVSAQGFLSYYEESEYNPGEKIAIKLDGHELSRGRGGPRCLTMPIARAPAPAP